MSDCPYCERYGTLWPLVSYGDSAGRLVVAVDGEELVCDVLVTDAETEMEDYEVLTARINYCPVCGRDLREGES